MVRSLPVINFTEYLNNCCLSKIRRTVVLFAATIALLFVTNNLSAQTIVETFEDASWATVNAGGSSTVAVASSTPTTTNQTITFWNETTGGTGTITTASASMSSVWTWGMSAVNNQSQNYSTCDVVPHSS